MEAINRAAVMVKPRQPFLDWLHRVDPTSQNLTLSDMQREPKKYLVPEYVYEHEVLTFLSQKVAQVFEEHLDGGIVYRKHDQRYGTGRHFNKGLNTASILRW